MSLPKPLWRPLGHAAHVAAPPTLNVFTGHTAQA